MVGLRSSKIQEVLIVSLGLFWMLLQEKIKIVPEIQRWKFTFCTN